MINRFLHAWFLMTIAATLVVGVVSSWDSTTLTLPLDIGLAAGLALAGAVTVFGK